MPFCSYDKKLSDILSVIFFISGASALIFESIWFHQAGLTLGNSVWASSIVLASFMAGLAIGSACIAFFGERVKFPLRFYVCVEIIIALFGIVTILLFSKSTFYLVNIYSFLGKNTYLLNFSRLTIAFSFMIVPTIAMGITLPLLVKALYRETSNFGQTLGLLYGWNTLGALTGVLLNELFIIKHIGVWGAGILAGSLNVVAALSAIYIAKNEPAIIPQSNTAPVASNIKHILLNRSLAGSFLAGAILLSLEVIWFRFLLLFFNSHSWNFAVMLATVLAGISFGGLFAAKWSRKNPSFHNYLSSLFLLNGLLLILLYGNFPFILSVFQKVRVDRFIFAAAIFLMFPVSFVSGIIFTALGNALYDETLSESRATSLLAMANTTGAMLGAIIGGYILLPILGTELSFFLLAIAYGLTSLLFWHTGAQVITIKNISGTKIVGALLIIAIVTFPFKLMENTFINISSELYADLTGEKRIAWREGTTETIQYMRKDIENNPLYYRLITNNYSMSATSKEAKRYMKYFVYWPIALLDNPKNALLICFGCGSTAKALTDTKSLKQIDIVDTSKDILEMSRVVYPKPEDNPTKDARVTLHVEDGRFFLQTSKNKYDLITAEPPPPSFNGVVNLYTQEYFHLIHESLKPGGIATYWLPVYQLRPSDSKAIVKAFCNEFPDCSLWSGAGLEWMLAGTNNLNNPISEKQFRKQWQDQEVGAEMKKLGFTSPEQFGSTFIADAVRLNQWVGATEPLVDNFPYRLSPVNRGWRNEVPVYRDFMNPEESLENFMHSDTIAKFWPHGIREASKEFFSAREVVNDLLMGQGTAKYSQLYALHQCLHNQRLRDYIPWALGSDHNTIEIVKSIMKTGPEKDLNISDFKVHLVAIAVMSGDYRLAEKILASNAEPTNHNRKWHELVLRIYLLLLVYDDEMVAQISKQYIATNPNPEMTAKRITKVVDWSKKAIRSDQKYLQN